ncbi:MAG TPA: nitrilase-related carbon-nitrogen hydrolase [Syntrophales bacterium]|nr:nitrilase-related carbon-nitrogen hydrolase [Syntrophales bacterium]HPQ44887.1 nitrilase-related carbon-nitrogen hydrolase [Syntrophales bacterium]
MKDIKLAVVCMRSEFGRSDTNITRMETFIHKATSTGARMICFPELSITGYSVRNKLRQYAEPIPGPISDHLVKVAKDKGVVVLAGMLEESNGETPYISHVITGPSGIIGVHRKTHLSPQERNVCQPGKEVSSFTFDTITFGIQLCYESHFPELSTIQTLQGADIIFFPYASPNKKPDEKRKSWLRTLPARAFDNSVFVVACNQTGENGAGLSFPGVILVLDPSGETRCQYAGTGEKMIIEEFKKEDLETIRSSEMQNFTRYRRPELYGSLSSRISFPVTDCMDPVHVTSITQTQ